MTKREIIKEAKKDPEILHYYTYIEDWNDCGIEHIVSNFDNDIAKMTDERLSSLVDCGVLTVDWDLYTVNI